MLLIASAVVGAGSVTFHPEASRVARMASGGRFGIGGIGAAGLGLATMFLPKTRKRGSHA